MTLANSKPSPLGRGLSALLGDVDASYRGASQNAPQNKNHTPTNKVAIEKLSPGTFQPRQHFDQDALESLATSIRASGIIQPLLVRPRKNAQGEYEIIAGERRWRASQLAGLHEVPVIVRDLTDREAMEYGLIENMQREGLTPLEEAAGYKRLLDEFNYTQEALGKLLGKSRPHITNIVRLLNLPDSVKAMLTRGEISMVHARAVITAKDPYKLAQEIYRRGLTARQADDLVRREAEGERIAKPRKATNKDANLLSLERDIARHLGLKVSIAMASRGGEGGSITILYNDLSQFDAVVKKLQSA